MRHCSLVGLALFVLTVSAQADPVVIYTNIGLGPGGIAGINFPSGGGGTFFFNTTTNAARFTTPGGSGFLLHSIDLAGEFILPSGAVPVVSVFTDSPSPLVNVSTAGPSNLIAATSEIVRFQSVEVATFGGPPVILDADTSYWVGMTSLGGGAIWTNSFEFVGQGLASRSFASDPWGVVEPFPQITRGFRVNATRVPEPALLVLLCIGALFVVRARRFLCIPLAMLTFQATCPADTITRETTITPSQADLSANGSFGSGVFWRPVFPLNPFSLEQGDTIVIVVNFAAGIRVVVDAGVIEQDSVFALVGTPGGQRTSYLATWDFLDAEGDLLAPSLTLASASEGGGIASNFNPVDLSDTSFSFGAVRFSFTITQAAGLPATFTEGVIAVQTQGTITFARVPEPKSLSLLAVIVVLALARRTVMGVRRAS